MSQTILIETSEDLRKIFSLNLNTFVGTDVIVRQSAEDTIALLKILPQVSLIITRLKVGEENTASILYDYIKAEKLETRLIVMGQADLGKDVMCVPDPIRWEILIREAGKCLGVTIKEANARVRPDYLPVGVFYFYDIQKVPCDIYIRIKKGPGEYQFVKRIHSKDTFDKDTIKKYEEQGLKEFFVSKDYIQYFTTFVTSNLVQKLERDDLTLEDRILTTANGHDIVRDTLTVQSMELDSSMVDLSDASINSMAKSVKDSPQVAGLLKFLFSNKVSFAYQQCHLTAMMGHYILSKQSWYKEEHLHIISFASFFADVTLKSENQMQISSMSELYEANLTDEERLSVLHHAKDAVNQLKSHPNANEFVKTVILQSHGKHDGVGFADNPEEDLHPLSKVYIVADTFVKILLNPALPSAKKDILPIIYGRFTNPSYQKIIKALEQKFE